MLRRFLRDRRYLIAVAWVLSILLSIFAGIYLGKVQSARYGQMQYEITYRKYENGARVPSEVIQASRDQLALERTVFWNQNRPFEHHADHLAKLFADNRKMATIVNHHGSEHYQSNEKTILRELDDALETLRHRDDSSYADQVADRVETLIVGHPDDPLFQRE